MALHADVTATGLSVYFAHPTHRGSGPNENLNRIVREFFPKASRSSPVPPAGYPLPAPPVLRQDDHLVLFACITPGQPRLPPWRHDQPAADRVPPPPVRHSLPSWRCTAAEYRNRTARARRSPAAIDVDPVGDRPRPSCRWFGRIGPGRALPRPPEGARSLELLEEVLLDAHVLDDSRFGANPEFILLQ
jgi:hypothetical protein